MCAVKVPEANLHNGLDINQGFGSFRSLKKEIGKAGDGMEWHHIVEQSQINKTGLPKEQIHNTSNIIAIDKATHRKITGHYNSKPDNLGGKSVREWLSTKSYEEQYAYGIDRLREFGVIH